MRGKVYLVGAGPGDIGLITVKGLNCLRRADVVVYDRLANEKLLDFANADAELIYVGKSAETHAMQQHQINQILIDKAGEVKTVVRLKGGDPFVLGRGAEEVEELAANGIPYEIVPGVSSALAGPAYAGIPVTHRKLASSFAVVTGHEDASKSTSTINWEKLATGTGTLVFLMGMGKLEGIVEKLIECGRSPETPVALIEQATTSRQRTVTGTLNSILQKANDAGLGPPGIIVVGDVVGVRDRLAWFDNRPLFARKILVTRAKRQANALSKLLLERGAKPVEWPVIEPGELSNYEKLHSAISRLNSFDWVLFTSVNAVEAFWKRLRALGFDARWFRDILIGAIGPATCRALESRGLFPDLIPDKYTTEGLVEGLARRGIHGSHILIPRSDIAPDDLVRGLVRLGAEPYEVAAYSTRLPESGNEGARQMLMDGQIDVITFTSSSTVNGLLRALGDDWHMANKAKIACIGPRTAATCRSSGLRVDLIAQEETIQGLVHAVEQYYSQS